MQKILMVCLGNICRSPLAEGVLKSKLNNSEFLVDSAGTANYHVGKKPDQRSIDVAHKMEIDISNQRARQFKQDDFAAFDYIYVMDKSNYDNVVALAKNEHDKQKIKLILSEINGEEMEVPDPYYGGDDGFKDVFNLLDLACETIAEKLNSKID